MKLKTNILKTLDFLLRPGSLIEEYKCLARDNVDEESKEVYYRLAWKGEIFKSLAYNSCRLIL